MILWLLVCYGRRLRSFKVIELSTHRKLVCEFLSVAHSNLCRFYPPKVIPWEHTVWNLMSKPGLSVLYPTVKIAWSFYGNFDHITAVDMSFYTSLRNFIQIRPLSAEKMTSCRFSRWRISVILDFILEFQQCILWKALVRLPICRQ